MFLKQKVEENEPPPNLEKRVSGIIRYNNGEPIIQIRGEYAHNPGGVKFKGKYYLLIRHQKTDPGYSNLLLYESEDGFNFTLYREKDCIPFGSTAFTTDGKEDARINEVFFDGKEGFAVTFTPYSRKHGPVVGLVHTYDFEKFSDLGVVLSPNNKDAVLFPKRFPKKRADGQYILFHRPTKGENNAIWSCRSPDLKHWGEHQVVLEPGEKIKWAEDRIGAGSPPIETKEGYILITHGANKDNIRYIYNTGIVLLDADDPAKVIRVSKEPLLVPETKYEKGKEKDIVFPTARVIEPDGQVKIYYGAGDKYTCLAITTLDYLIYHVLHN